MKLRIAVHFVAGATGIVLFLLTGQYMDLVHDKLRDVPAGPRMLYRSAHIYILLASILNLSLSFHPSPANGWRKVLSILVSLVAILSIPLFVAGFFIEPQLDGFERPFSQPALYALSGSGLALVILFLFRGQRGA